MSEAPAYSFVGAAPPGPTTWLSVVLPCCNERAVIVETYRRVRAVCNGAGRPFEIVLVNDGSSDGTWEEMLRLAEQDASLVLVNLSRNHGHQIALAAGLHVAGGERILMLDADLQDPPELLPEMLKLMDDGADVVYAQRRSRRGDAAPKRAAASIFYRLLRGLSEAPIHLDAGDFRLINRRVLEVLLQMPERNRFVRGMVAWAGFRQVACPYDREERLAGESKYPFRKLLRLAVDGIASSSLRPLAFATVAGGLAGALGLGLLAYSLFSWLFVGRTPPGWTSLIITVTLLSSVQLFVLGIIGEYLGRLFEESRRRPLFIIERVVRSGGRAGPPALIAVRRGLAARGAARYESSSLAGGAASAGTPAEESES